MRRVRVHRRAAMEGRENPGCRRYPAPAPSSTRSRRTRSRSSETRYGRCGVSEYGDCAAAGCGCGEPLAQTVRRRRAGWPLYSKRHDTSGATYSSWLKVPTPRNFGVSRIRPAVPELGPWQAIWPVRRCRCRPDGTAELRLPFGLPPSTWSQNVIARSEFPYIAEIAPDPVLSCPPRAGCPPLGTWGWTAWATTNEPTYRTGFSRAAGPRARPGQTGTPPQQTKPARARARHDGSSRSAR